jgi:hypothetical protein
MLPHGGPVIGLDLDNTLVGYDELLCELAVSEGFLPGPPPAFGKRALRDALRAKGDQGEQEWRRLQALIYGAHMPRARLMDGVAEFLARVSALRAAGVPFGLYVVSHKTRRANNYSDGADFHAAALDFLEAAGFFAPETGLTRAQVFFEPDRAAKVARIASLGCTLFVDDLEETYAEPTFPDGVTRILYDPAGDAAEQAGVLRLGSWREIADALLCDLEARAGFAALLGEPVAECRRIYGGRNSRVYRVTTARGVELAGKHYHRHRDDPRDRLGAEWRALALLARHEVGRVARPVAMDESRGLALYAFLCGEQACRLGEEVAASPEDRDRAGADMDQCLDFLAELRSLARELSPDEAEAIPPASEACFSLAELETNLRGRLDALRAVPVDACLGAELAAFMAEELGPFLEASLARARELLGDPAAELPQAERTLSPSDFGLHNALRAEDGLAFVDFEYFGWDDPAKTLCDFVLHPAMNLPPKLRRRFAEGFLKRFAGQEGQECGQKHAHAALRKRALAVYPLFGVKWCLILLNEFLRGADARRRFAAGAQTAGTCGGDLERRRAQLAKARAMLEKVRTSNVVDGVC